MRVGKRHSPESRSMNRHTALVRVLPFVFALVAGLWILTQSLLTGALAQFIHTPYQLFIALLCMSLMFGAFATGMLLWAFEQPHTEIPRQHRHTALRALFHH